jgi:hypothetical protein
MIKLRPVLGLSFLRPPNLDEFYAVNLMTTYGNAVGEGTIQANFTKCPPGTEHEDQKRISHVE